MRVFVLPALLGAAVGLAVLGVHFALEALLANLSDYNRGLWEGAAIVLVVNGGTALANLVLKHVDTRKKERS